MDYEKKYKEALDRARIYRDNAKAVEEYSAVARYENIFPELREDEDERIRQFLIERIISLYGADSVTPDGIAVNDIVSYLEKQKEQKPMKWSEEDDRVFEFAIARVEIYERDFLHGNNEMSERLKALHPRPSWKPSEEQMNRLCAVVDAAIRKHNESVSGYEPARVLKSLYEQLKKL